MTGHLLALVTRRWALRVPESPYVFHRSGRRLVRFDTAWDAACEAVGLPGLLFHDLRRSGARNYRRAGVGEDVIQRIGGWKTASMFKRYNIVDERDLADAGERLVRLSHGRGERVTDHRPDRGRACGAPRDRNTDRTRTIWATSMLHQLAEAAVSS